MLKIKWIKRLINRKKKTCCLNFRIKNGSILETKAKVCIRSKTKLAKHYSPGVAEVVKQIQNQPDLVHTLSFKKKSVAIISDGSAVLGLGNVGPLAALPVMEGKSLLLKTFANIDGVPIVLNSNNPNEIIQTIKNIAPTFAAINLEDIKAPGCFNILQKLKKDIDIPIIHDDQEGTAIVCLTAIINALQVVKKDKKNCKIVIVGAGAAGIAIGRILQNYGVKNICMFDSKGQISNRRKKLSVEKSSFKTKYIPGGLKKALEGSDILVGVSSRAIISTQMIQKMAKNSIVFPLANPIPEISVKNAFKGGAKIVATGSACDPNQINNLIIFPGLLRALIKNKHVQLTVKHQVKIANELSKIIKKPSVKKFMPNAVNQKTHERVFQIANKILSHSAENTNPNELN